MISGHAFQEFPALDAAPINTGQHDSTVLWYSKIHLSAQSYLIQFRAVSSVQSNKKKSQQYSHCSLFTPQTPALLFSGSLCIQAFHRSTRALIMTWADFFFTQLSCTYYNNPEYSKEALSALLLGELKCGKRFDLQK